jgi:NADH-quinone oxidoreductase subunit L
MELPEHSQTTFDFFGYPLKAVDLIGISLLIGAMGKSAQFGLHTWLPDAMEGPTPVSALIHAATMVTAGIFVVVRMSPLMDMSPLTRYVMVVLGTLTALYGATVALTQSDIKKIIAYSTCSQLGLMLLACGCGSYAAALFHLTTHAFFKALLFLGAGSVIHAMSDEQNIHHMGGLYKHIPYTYGFMWVGSLAIAGIPFLAGYFSKEAMMESIYQSGHTWAFGIALVVAMLTAIYSWRLLLLVFHGQPKGDEQLMAHVHESPPLMLAPLGALSLGAILGGVVGYQWFMLQEWGFHWGGIIPLDHEASYTPALAQNIPTLAAAMGIGLAFVIYCKAPHVAKGLSHTWLQRFLLHAWFVDELYNTLMVKPYAKLSRFLAITGDQHTIDRYGPNGLAHIALYLGRALKGSQSGYLYHYASLMCLGLILLIGFALLAPYKPWLKALLRLS